MVRCKYVCVAVTKKKHWDKTRTGFLYEAEFNVVSSGSEENKLFFDATPFGVLKIGTYQEDHFQPGVEYYLDISEAVVVTA